MPSNLHQLLRYARPEKVDAKENFTTEALAGAIGHDPAPILQVLHHRGWLADAQHAEVIPRTQVHVSGTGFSGFVDLVLEVSRGISRDIFWIEVKVDAGEHGEQLANYGRYVKEQGGMLLTLGREALSAKHVTWHEVRRAALDHPSSPYWADLARFLEEIGMADDYDQALLDEESAALGHSYALLRKMIHVLGPVGRHANGLWPGSKWPCSAEDVRESLGSHFVKHRRLTISNGLRTAPAWLVVGVLPDDAPGTATVMNVGVEARPKDMATRRILEQLLRDAMLSETWAWPRGAWSVLRARAPLPTHAELPALSGWFTQRLDELHAAGLFTKLGEMTRGAPPGDSGGNDD